MIATNGHRDAVLKNGNSVPSITVGADIPTELLTEPRWVNWAWKWNDKRGKWDKPPLKPSGANASSTDPSTWVTYETAIQAHHTTGMGIGYVLNGDGLIGLDLDDCRDPLSGKINEWAQGIIDRAATYTEFSPSGTGVKLLLKGTLPEDSRSEYPRDDGSKLEVFSSGRYFTITGQRTPGTPAEINNRTQELTEILATAETWRPQKKSRANRNGHHAERALKSPDDDRETALAALAVLNPDMGYSEWVRVGMALHSVDSSLVQNWASWSMRSEKFAQGECEDKWSTFSAGSGVGIATLCQMADETGQKWRPAKKRKKADGKKRAVARAEAEQAGDDPWTSIRFDEGRTDLAFSRRFLNVYGNLVLWVPTWKAWLVWDGCRWRIDDGACAVTRFASSISDSIWHETAEYHTEAALKFATDMGKPSRWASALKAAAAQKAVSTADLNVNHWLLNCPNGTVDLRTGELRPHRQEDLLTTLCPTKFDPEAASYQWDRFLDGVFPSAVMQDYLRRLFGYALAGRAAKAEEILPVMWGDGSNGKSRFIEAIRVTVGSDFAGPAAHGLLTEKTNDRHATERASLYGKRYVFCSETGHGAALDEDLVKAMTGGDCIKARFCHKDEFEFSPTFTLFLITNARPRVRGTDNGIWRRLNLVPWQQRFWREWMGESGPTELKADPGIGEKLEAERSGILAWLVRGCLEWQRDGLQAPESVRIATAEYRSTEDQIGQFVAQNCVLMPQVRVKFSAFYEAYEQWCEANGERPLKGKTVSVWLQQHGCEQFRSNGMWYQGVALEA